MSLIKTLRGPRIGPFAVFDFASSLAVAWFAAPYLGVSRERALWAVIPLGVAAHQVFGIETPLNKMVFGPGHWPAKAAVAGLTFKALTHGRRAA